MMATDIATAPKVAPALDVSDRPTGLGYHIIYSSPEKFDAMVDFYSLLLGGKVGAAPDGLNNEQVLNTENDIVLIVKRPDLPKTDLHLKPGVLHTAWFYNSLAELMYVYRAAREKGFESTELLNTDVLMQFYFYDPEGNQVEIGVDNHDTAEETQEIMRDQDGKRQPGLMEHWAYNPEKVLKMVEAGIPDADIFDHKTYHELAASGRF